MNIRANDAYNEFFLTFQGRLPFFLSADSGFL